MADDTSPANHPGPTDPGPTVSGQATGSSGSGGSGSGHSGRNPRRLALPGWRDWGVRSKLLSIFIVIKILPLLFLAWLAWDQSRSLGNQVIESSEKASRFMNAVVDEIGKTAVDDATRALDERSREAIERLTTDTARSMARFLYARDADVLVAASLPPDEQVYRRFLDSQTVPGPVRPRYELKADLSGWEEVASPASASSQATEMPVLPTLPQAEQEKSQVESHIRPPDPFATGTRQPLYAEMSFVGLDGMEKVKVVSSDLTSPELRNISQRENTFVRAENYFDELRQLKPGEIYVSRVTGAYVGSSVIGPYTPDAAAKAGIPFAPEQSAFAGRENPGGKRFQGIVRWATPVVVNGQVTGYVTLALYHRHLMAFTDQIIPTSERYTTMKDASRGNYAMAYDFEGRNIAHPREYTIVGYDPQSGKLVPPWMTEEMYAEWQGSGLELEDWLARIPSYRDPSLRHKPAREQVAAGQLAVFCPYTDFAPQCASWYRLTEHGGSGSFLLYWSGLWKLSTVATIPYYTGQYGGSARGFGWVSLTANVDEFHSAATASRDRISQMQAERRLVMDRQHRDSLQAIRDNLHNTFINLTVSTALTGLVVVGVAIWLAAVLSRRIGEMILNIRRFEKGEAAVRLPVSSSDELGQLALSFNRMAGRVESTLTNLETRNQELQKIAYAASHDFVEPLRSVVSFSQMLRRRYESLLDESGKQYLGFVIQSGLRMRRLLDGLQAYVHVLAEPPQSQVVDSAVVAAGVVRSLAARMKETGADVTLGPLPMVMANIASLEQILYELLDNAITAARPGVPAFVSIQAQPEQTHWHFTVRDNGKGIDAVYLERIFQLFQKLDLRDDGMATGMGLSLCQKLVEAHGGRIWAESAPGEGTTFHFTLPVVPENS